MFYLYLKHKQCTVMGSNCVEIEKLKGKKEDLNAALFSSVKFYNGRVKSRVQLP